MIAYSPSYARFKVSLGVPTSSVVGPLRSCAAIYEMSSSQMAEIIIVGGKVDGTLTRELMVSYLGSVATVRSCKNLHGYLGSVPPAGLR
jgi:hypothetical protein